MRYWYDWEFEEDGSTIIPISLGMVAEDGRELYLINNTYMLGIWHKEHTPIQWLKDNVLCHLSPEDCAEFGYNIQGFPAKVLNFISDGGKYKSRREIELWGHYAAYDHVCLAQLWGPMVDLPSPIPMFTNEDMSIRNGQALPERDLEQFPEHHALWDAKFQKYQWECWTNG